MERLNFFAPVRFSDTRLANKKEAGASGACEIVVLEKEEVMENFTVR
jgi:hypothetical protein